MGKVKVTIRFVHTVHGARDGNPSAVRAIPYKRDESEAIMGNDDRRGKASFIGESVEKYDIMPMYAERQSQEYLSI